MKFASVLAVGFLASAAFGLSPAQAQQCPIGSAPWVDTWGNKICKRMDDGSTATTEVPRGQQCPVGAHPWVDSWGNKICQSDATPNQPRTNYYDTSKGCPVGTHEWVDTWGNKVCKSF